MTLSLEGFLPAELRELDRRSPLVHRAVRDAYDAGKTTQSMLVDVVLALAKRLAELEGER